MTPAVKQVQKAGVAYQLHEYTHQAGQGYGEEAANILQQPPERVFKTLLVALDEDMKRLAVAVVPVAGQLNLKAVASALNVKKVVMAEPAVAERTTGYLVGGISPLGQKKRLPTLIDQSCLEWETIFFSAGKRGLELELSPQALITLCAAKTAPIGR